MIQYLLSSSICMAIILGMYQCFLSKESMYQFNRYYLIFGLMASFVIPLLTIESGFGDFEEIERISPIKPIIIEIGASTPSTAVNNDTISYSEFMLFLIAFISVGFLIRFCFNFLSIILRISRNKIEEFNEYNIVLTHIESTPYVFWNYIFVNEQAYTQGQIEDPLLSHEIAHAQERHSLDIIIIELFQIAFWFNPLIYFYKRAIQLNHEFIADQFVLKRYNDVRSYQSLLLEKVQQPSDMSLVSNLNFYITKQRLRMMTKETSKIRTYTYSGVVAILFVCLTLGFSKTEAQGNLKIASAPKYDMSKDHYYEDAQFLVRNKNVDGIYFGYKAISLGDRELLPLPPTRSDGRAIEPLDGGTIVIIEGKNVKITGDGWVPKPPTPPEPISTIPQPTSITAPEPPEPIQIVDLPTPPPPPSPIEYIDEMIDFGAIFYFNGRKISYEDVRNFPSEKISRLWLRTIEKNGEYRVYLIE